MSIFLFWENPNITDSKKGPLITVCFPPRFLFSCTTSGLLIPLLHTSGLRRTAFVLLIRPESSKGHLWGLMCARMSHENRWSSGMVLRRASVQSQSNRFQCKITPDCLCIFFFHPFLGTMTKFRCWKHYSREVINYRNPTPHFLSFFKFVESL